MNFVITGGARGIGRGLTRLLIAKGHHVCVIDNNVTELDQLERIIPEDRRGHLRTYHCDLSEGLYVQSAASAARIHFDDKIDCLINNAAHTATAVGAVKFEDFTVNEWHKSLSVNLTAPFLLSQKCLPGLEEVKGSIINISSTRARQSEPDSTAYTASKAGLLGLTHSMAASLADKGVRVNAILPGWIHVANECRDADEKGMKWEDGLSKEDMRWHWSGRVGKVEDVLGGVV